MPGRERLPRPPPPGSRNAARASVFPLPARQREPSPDVTQRFSQAVRPGTPASRRLLPPRPPPLATHAYPWAQGPSPAPPPPPQSARASQLHPQPAPRAPHAADPPTTAPAMEAAAPRRRHTHQRGRSVLRIPHLNKVSPGPTGHLTASLVRVRGGHRPPVPPNGESPLRPLLPDDARRATGPGPSGRPRCWGSGGRTAEHPGV